MKYASPMTGIASPAMESVWLITFPVEAFTERDHDLDSLALSLATMLSRCWHPAGDILTMQVSSAYNRWLTTDSKFGSITPKSC